ncbi:hypothetical protein D3C72_1579260 [compost metagenome]
MAEAQAAEGLGNDHSEEALLAQEAPHLGRQVVRLVDGVVVEHAAQRGHLVRQKGFFARAELVGAGGRQRVEIGAPPEELALEPDRAGLERGTLGVAQRRQGLGERLHRPSADQGRQWHGVSLRRTGARGMRPFLDGTGPHRAGQGRSRVSETGSRAPQAQRRLGACPAGAAAGTGALGSRQPYST